MPVADLATFLASLNEIEGVTFSGGEPFAQAKSLSRLVDEVSQQRELSFMSYSGFVIEQLRHGTEAQRELLSRLDVLVDGPFVSDEHANLLWRGSANQRIHFLSSRYQHLKGSEGEVGVQLEFEVLQSGEVSWMGIPPADFDSVKKALAPPRFWGRTSGGRHDGS